MVNEQGLLEGAEVESQVHENDQSQVNPFTSVGRRDTLRKVFGREETSSDEDNLGLFSERDKQSSPLRLSGHPRVPQVEHPGTRPAFLPGPSNSTGQEGKTPYS